MFRSLIIFLAFAIMAIATKDPYYCYEDGCKRTLEHARGGKEQCKKDLSCKVTPAAVVTYSTKKVHSGEATIYITKSTSVPTPVAAVTTCATASIPPYLAKSCEYIAASYTSACSCIGASGSTYTARAPTVTAVVTVAYPTATVTKYV